MIGRGWYILLIALLSVSCNSSKEGVGVGLIHFEKDFTTRLDFYSEPDGKGAFVFSAELIYDSTQVQIETTLKKNGDLKFRPFYSLGGRGLVVMRVMDRKGDWIRVLTDDSEKSGHWLKVADPEIETWESFLKSLYRVRPDNGVENPLRKSSGNGGVLLERFEITCFSITHVRGDWIRVLNEPGNCDEPMISNYPYAGFLRWKREGEILIHFRI